MDKHKTLNKKKVILGVLFAIYIASYAFFRIDHLFIHICYHIDGYKHYDGVLAAHPDTPEILFLDWCRASFLIFLDIIYKPLMMLEAFLHSYNLLPSSCPWK